MRRYAWWDRSGSLESRCPERRLPIEGSITSAHLRLLGFAWQSRNSREDAGPRAVVGEVPFQLRARRIESRGGRIHTVVAILRS